MEKNYSLKLKIVRATGIVFQGEVKSVGITTTSGRITLLPNHSALISTLASGNIDLETIDGEEKSFPAESGVLDVNPEGAVILVHSEILDSNYAE